MVFGLIVEGEIWLL